MTKEYLVSMTIEGIGGTSSYITFDKGRIDTQTAEDEFYALLRKSTKAITEVAEDDAKSAIIDKLTPAQEEKLKESHAGEYIGTDDDMPDAYEDWLMDLTLQELESYLATYKLEEEHGSN